MDSLTLSQFRLTQKAGGVLGVVLRGEGTSFELYIETTYGPATLVKMRKLSNGEPDRRRFSDLEKALSLLQQVGIYEARIHSQQWKPKRPTGLSD
ncbi:hypothetical protein [Burkholderia cenocepacia]|uniref:hypothetical protein n=1 Tax=Burkholderia cenocepacia TaxID=95486 RepID=UPI000754F994|nr:hypothetical protein [Burkholderia cenocepacia]AOK38731.1 hypothetical protein WL90_31215 [Burkholderia cenocepacia]KWF71085.1 hypothetical protein WL89_04640 [Burkholderia cenocepacia]